MSAQIEQLAIAAHEVRERERAERKREEVQAMGRHLALTLRNRLGIELPEVPTCPVAVVGRLMFILEKKLSEIGTGYDYILKACVEFRSTPGRYSDYRVVSTIADLGELIAFVDKL